MIGIAKVEGGFSETEIDEEVVVMNLDSGEFFSLTGTARAIWRLIDRVRNREALLAALAADFAVPAADIAADADAFLAELAAAGLIHRV